MAVTASKLHDFLQCPHGVWRDEWDPQDEKNPEPNPFVQILWERGVKYEKERLALAAGEVVNIRLRRQRRERTELPDSRVTDTPRTGPLLHEQARLADREGTVFVSAPSVAV